MEKPSPVPAHYSIPAPHKRGGIAPLKIILIILNILEFLRGRRPLKIKGFLKGLLFFTPPFAVLYPPQFRFFAVLYPPYFCEYPVSPLPQMASTRYRGGETVAPVMLTAPPLSAVLYPPSFRGCFSSYGMFFAVLYPPFFRGFSTFFQAWRSGRGRTSRRYVP